MPDASPAFQFASPLLDDVRTHGVADIVPIHGLPYDDAEIKMGSEDADFAADSNLADDGNNVMDGHQYHLTTATATATAKDGEMIESYDRRELIAFAHDDDDDDDAAGEYCLGAAEEPLFEGMEFDSVEDVRASYNAYAHRTGFCVRLGRCQRSARDGTIPSRSFVCIQKNQGSRSHKRQGCTAMLAVRKQQTSGKWLVTKFIREHTHEPTIDLKPWTGTEVDKVENFTEEENESPAQSERELVMAPTFPLQRSSELELFEGKEFQSEEAARTFYYAYAKDMGFTVRISKCRRAPDGSIICRRFVCSKEGYYVRKYGSTKRSRALTRVGCLARLVVKKLDSGSWVVANFEREHNHPPFAVGNELGSCQPPKPMSQTVCGGRPSLPSLTGSMSSRGEGELQNGHNCLTWRFNKLHREGIRFAEEGSTSVEIFNMAMLALREATQKVVSAKENAFMAPSLGNLISGDNLVGNRDQASNSESQIALISNKQCSNRGRQAESPSGVMAVKQPVSLLFIAPGLHSESAQGPLAVKLPNGQAVHVRQEEHQLNIAFQASGQKRLSPVPHRLDGNGSLDLGMPAGRRTIHRITEDNKMNYATVRDFSEGDIKLDGIATQTKGLNVLGVGQPGSSVESDGDPSGMALSEAQVTALQAVAEAFNVPTMGATSSSALPIKVLPVSNELSEDDRGYSLRHGVPCQSSEMLPQQCQDATTVSAGPNPLVHAAAIAAGARIASPAVAASLIKAVQSKTAVRIRSRGELVMPKLPSAASIVGAESCLPLSRVRSQISDIHYFCGREPSSLQINNAHVVPTDTLPETHLMTTLSAEVRDLRPSMHSEHTAVSNTESE